MIERRQHRRADLKVPVEIRTLDVKGTPSQAPLITGRTHNVSLAGISAIVPASASLGLGTLVSCSVNVPPSAAKQFPFTRLLGKGWERLAQVREKGSTVRVLILNTETTIGGLVVMITDENQIIFTNVAGVLDLAKLGALGKEMNIPGLQNVEKDEKE